jgi:hypothetical protein
MADKKKSRDKQAHDEDRRQRQRDMEEAQERMGESEPPIDDADIAGIGLDSLSYPATGADIAENFGDDVIESSDESYRVKELVPETEAEKFNSSSDIEERLKRPTVAEAMKRVVEALGEVQHAGFGSSQRDAYEKTLRELKDIDADDDDEGVNVVTDWIVERIHEKEKLPGSRAVRKRAAEFCRENGYEIRNDEWLGA